MIKKLSVLSRESSYEENNFSSLRRDWKSNDPSFDTVLSLVYSNLFEEGSAYIRTNSGDYWEVILENQGSTQEVRESLSGIRSLKVRDVKVGNNPFGEKKGVLISVEKHKTR